MTTTETTFASILKKFDEEIQEFNKDRPKKDKIYWMDIAEYAGYNDKTLQCWRLDTRRPPHHAVQVDVEKKTREYIDKRKKALKNKKARK